MMDMQLGLLARQRHHERIAHALGPRPEPYGPRTPRPTRQSLAPLSRKAQHLVRLRELMIPLITSRRIGVVADRLGWGMDRREACKLGRWRWNWPSRTNGGFPHGQNSIRHPRMGLDTTHRDDRGRLDG